MKQRRRILIGATGVLLLMCFYLFWSSRVPRLSEIVMAPTFDEGLASTLVGEKYGYTNERRQVVIEPRYDEAHEFSNGLAPVRVGFRWSYIDKTGAVKITVNGAELVAPFREGLAQVVVGGKWGFIDTTGNMVIAPKFDDATSFHNGVASVRMGTLHGDIDKTGNFVRRNR